MENTNTNDQQENKHPKPHEDAGAKIETVTPETEQKKTKTTSDGPDQENQTDQKDEKEDKTGD
ncbi:hypothetical protein [Pedobacter sp. MC2016-24]|uniref:hypothetical protein n=1 Tax=Pedobacter sp. MC2016-24 TaxID=2780090 RepID=UPI0018826E70|nr:hypothetical protein [Pedobacter sp. MC2016-24]MBE9598018.1 hypothetical protein [Pedobacter sp. MC2016-24]